MQEQAPARGFQSSVDYVLTFGLGARDTVDALEVAWPDGRTARLAHVAANRRLVVRQADAPPGRPSPALPAAPPRAPGALLAAADSTALDFAHRENDFIDFDRERLIPKMVSTEGPALAVADVNGDGLDDAYLGGAKEQAGRLLLQRADGGFAPSNPGLFEADAIAEDVGAAFFDANGDGRPDLYVVSGGSEFSEGADALHDRLYLNDGAGRFRKAPQDALPYESASGSRVAPFDFDADGDVDLFVGGRVEPGRYGADPQSMLLQNDGRGRFTDVTDRVAPGLARVGMVTDATWQDADGDGRRDLVLVGEWMPITIFRNAGGRLAKMDVPGLARSHGWWNRVVAGDFTGDGRVDFVVGNLGLNTRLAATEREPVTMYVKDFDRNGFAEQVLSTYVQGKPYVLPLRDDLIRAIPPLKARFLNYRDYAGKTFDQVFPAADLEGATVRTAYTFASALVRNDGRGRFTLVPLPDEAQRAPVYGIAAGDVDGDGKTDLLLAGNFDGLKPEIGRAAASYGLLLAGDPSRCGARDTLCSPFRPVPTARSGFFVPGATRDVQRVRTRAGAAWLVARNDGRALLFRRAPRAPAPTPRVVAATPTPNRD
jgi:enediyne biosynthesis protein E4